MSNIRNFVIISHIDHGKSTLADRFLELTGTVEQRKMRERVLDQMELEREKGITIKMQPVRMMWHQPARTDAPDTEYILNLIDTPGHVDFTYEVSRALACVEGAILLVDATQGVQAQTVANLNLARAEQLVIIPAVNKVDLPSADVERTKQELAELLGIDASEVYAISGKTGAGVEELLNAVIERVPSPRIPERSGAGLRALVFDSTYDAHLGVISYVRIFEGAINTNDTVHFLATSARASVLEVGAFAPGRVPIKRLESGEVGYIATGLKKSDQVRVGDTIAASDVEQALAGYKEPMPVVFASIFPESSDDYESLRDALEKLELEDAALSFEPEEGAALGRGFRTGFLGMLHMEIIAERLRREYGLALVFSSPSVAFQITLKDSSEETHIIYSAARMPPGHEILHIEEPWVHVEIIAPSDYLGGITSLIHEHSGVLLETKTVGIDRLVTVFEAPLRAIIVDFYDKLKSISRGFASLAYELAGYRAGDLLRIDILVAGDRVAAFSEMVERSAAYAIGKARVEKLKGILPRALFAVALQAEVEGRIIARETVPALKKDVTGYLYGGDRTRKMKLWKKQKRGKKRLAAEGNVTIPSDVFLKMLKR